MTKTEAVASLFRANAGIPVSALELIKVGGLLAWRTEVSRCRKQLKMVIDYVPQHDPVYGRVSFYRYRAVEHSQ